MHLAVNMVEELVSFAKQNPSGVAQCKADSDIAFQEVWLVLEQSVEKAGTSWGTLHNSVHSTGSSKDHRTPLRFHVPPLDNNYLVDPTKPNPSQTPQGEPGWNRRSGTQLWCLTLDSLSRTDGWQTASSNPSSRRRMETGDNDQDVWVGLVNRHCSLRHVGVPPIQILNGHREALKPFVRIKIGVSEESVTVVRSTAPLGLANVVVGDDHDVGRGKLVNDESVGLRVGHIEEFGVVVEDAGFDAWQGNGIQDLPSASITVTWAGQFAHCSFTRCPVVESTIHLLLAESGKECEWDGNRESREMAMAMAMNNGE
ncbi:uncharacterized protein G2W53_025147 [Senna tora]|uniref:Uncharacterized protein n=1 Tax=Senna tora TaxID=362788 RepID=A0A834TEP8_9FABA|nr:uncharacterized protein G2W53_025147 [Senna tora]